MENSAISVEQIKRIVEASLLMNREPQAPKKLAELFTPEENINERAIVDTLTLLAEDYRGRGIELVEVATGYRFQVCADLAPWIQRTMTERPQRYSRALLETLALIAYRQPITRAEIEEIRGVVVSTQIMRTLEEREWVRVIGHRDVPGRPALYATTKQFLNDLNLKSLGELPTLAELQDLDKIDGEFQQLNLDIATSQEASAEHERLEGERSEANPENNENRSSVETDEKLGDETITEKSDESSTEISLDKTEQVDNIVNLFSDEDPHEESIEEALVVDEDLMSEDQDEISDEELSAEDEDEDELIENSVLEVETLVESLKELINDETSVLSTEEVLSVTEVEEVDDEETSNMLEQEFSKNVYHEMAMDDTEELELTETETETE